MKRQTQPSRETPQIEVVSASVAETQALGERIGRALHPGDVVALYGELGSGKTTLVQGLVRGSGRDPEVVKSPTFVLQREYPGQVPLIHVDGYRLGGAQEATWLDLDLLFVPRKITVIEWAERFEGLLPESVLEVRLSHLSANRRRIAVRAMGPHAAAVIGQLRAAEGAPAGASAPGGEGGPRPTSGRSRPSSPTEHDVAPGD